jgi:hypothetical protein
MAARDQAIAFADTNVWASSPDSNPVIESGTAEPL